MAAHAVGSDFTGGCSYDVVHQESVTGQSWIGEADVVIVATDNSVNKVPDLTASITNVSCELFINGVSQGTVLTAPSGTGVTANAGRFEFTANATDSTMICTNATINGDAIHRCDYGLAFDIRHCGPVIWPIFRDTSGKAWIDAPGGPYRFSFWDC